MENIESCPICNSENITQFMNCNDYTVSNKSFQICECKECSFKFTNPRPDVNEILKYYESENYISHSNTKKGVFNKLYQYIRNITISQKISLINKHVSRGTLLDIGCGTGEFLNHCKIKGWGTTGIEPGNAARKYAVEQYGLTVHNEDFINSIPDNSFDVITLWHVLEHVHELNNRVDEIKRIVKKTGVIIIAVPNHTSYDANYYKEFWAAYDLPRHLYHFSPSTLTNLFEKHGLKTIEIFPMQFDSFYVSMLSEKYKTGKINYVQALLTGFKSNRKAAYKKDNSYSSQIYIFKKV